MPADNSTVGNNGHGWGSRIYPYVKSVGVCISAQMTASRTTAACNITSSMYSMSVSIRPSEASRIVARLRPCSPPSSDGSAL